MLEVTEAPPASQAEEADSVPASDEPAAETEPPAETAGTESSGSEPEIQPGDQPGAASD